MTLAPGARLGPYEIIAPLGSGGMGEVYRARDPRLDRQVAIKVLPAGFTSDRERLARFDREARLLAAMSHSGIATIYGLEGTADTPALVMELVEGPTLAERIERGPLRPDEALAIARPLAEALEYAHDRGIVHRDFKPANVKLRPDGMVKVLDFGLARAFESDSRGSGADLSQSPTITQRQTLAGVILGTAAYMAPEQARGREADRRADVWAFGAVLFEMLTGRRAFGGETISETLASVMRDEPDWTVLPAGLSPRWRRLLERCLTKDPKRRLQAIGEARIALEDLAANPTEPLPEVREAGARPASRRGAGPLVPWIIALLALAMLAVTLLRRPAVPGATELSVVPPPGMRIGMDLGYHPLAISPDGRAVVYSVRTGGQLRARLRHLDTREDVELAGTDGARNFFFSPDGQWIGFFDSRKMYKVSVRGGTPIELTDALQDRLGAWLDDGTIVFSRETTEPLYRIRESGGAPVAVTTLDSTRRERTHRFPCALAGGPWVVFTVQRVDSPGNYEDADIDAVSVRTGERRHLFHGARRAVWAPGGFLVLARGNDLYAVPIDPRNPRLTQDPVPVLSGVAGDVSSGASFFGIANDGTLAWIPGGEPDGRREIGWLDRSGRWTSTPVPVGPYMRLMLAPDGTRAIVEAGPGGGGDDLWFADLRTGSLNRLTYGARSGSAAWFADGIRFAYSRQDTTGGETIMVRRLDGAGGDRPLYHGSNPLLVSAVTRDGRVLFGDYGVAAGRIHAVPFDHPDSAVTLPAQGSGYEMEGRTSADGRWLAFISNKTRREDIFLRRLDGIGGNWQLSPAGGGGIRWGRGGRELFFVVDESLVRVPIEVRGEGLSIGKIEPVFEVPPSPTEEAFRDYDYDPVSDRFLFTRPPQGAMERREIAISLGWSRRLAETIRARKKTGS